MTAPENAALSAAGFREKLEGLLAGMPPKALPLDEAALEAFCRLTGHDWPAYRARGVIPPGFFMTLTTPIMSELFIKLFVAFPKLLKGVIHTASHVEIHDDFRLSAGPFSERLSLKQVEEKAGSKGNYFAADFEVVLLDAGGKILASDLHQFFMRV